MSAEQSQRRLKWSAGWRAHGAAVDQLIDAMLDRADDPTEREQLLWHVEELMLDRTRKRVREVIDWTRDQPRKPQLVLVANDQISGSGLLRAAAGDIAGEVGS